VISLDVHQDGAQVLLVLNGRRLLGMGWKPALEFCSALDQHLRNAEAREWDPEEPILPEAGVKIGAAALTVRQDLGKILVIGNGRLLFDMPAAVARQVWRAVKGKAKLAEEHDAADRVIADNALLLRTGAPFGLSDNPRILAESAKEAAHNRDLRRFIPGGVQADRLRGAPRVSIETRTPAQQLRDLAGKDPVARAAIARALSH
jgi:hypothetical protein